MSRFFLATVVMLALAAPVTEAAWSITDQTGQTLTLAAAPTRIVSLVPSATEILFAIGAEDRLVGVTDFCDFPPEARRKPSVGGMISPSLEALVALKPEVVIATAAGNRQETFTQLRRLRIPVFAVGADSLAETVQAVERLAELAGRREAAATVVGELNRRIRAVAERVAPFSRPRVLYVLWPEPLIVPGHGALISDLIAVAGGDSVTASRAEAYPRYSLEAAVAKTPEVILLASHSSRQTPMAHETWERFGSLPAVKAGRVHWVNGDLVHRYGPRVVEGLELLARLIHPEAFAR